ncbi:DNA-3-methyladenine glycosylase 2 family protein [Salinisphaera sp. P385]|uniref:DNA-3-methyladenine glycosylase II n=1 Tax=Spectribacter acetivorans TaxID=3075603 RepID=A0ABU3B9Y3_9GAMM|nr:DNA-3-methyladenine glycosylase 2 family protein [Salinisphaera sp. P385]MDT0619285.1 DNA-3-methyladenine glycosylase 2 family protein [Salinisphaera sp. P385]
MSVLTYDPAVAARALSATDPRLAGLIERVGPVRFGADRMRGDTFEVLLRAIVYQQLSGKAAGTIHARILALFGDNRASAAGLERLDDEQLRGAGLSVNKLRAARDLADHCLNGRLPDIRRLRQLDDETVIERLTAVRGIGRWTAEMLLIFRLGRPDIWPVDDLGVRKGYAVIRGCEMPSPAALADAGKIWAPWRSVAAWYCWRAVQNPELLSAS